jgi:hypothetical protein
MRTNWDVLSARTLGALALPDACERCFWLHQRIGAPDSPFPGIFSSIDSYSKKVLQAALQYAQRLPHWFERFGLHGEPLPSPHHSWFKIATGHGSLQLSGTPDEILLAPDGSLIIIDYKTARYNPKDHLRPLYEVQLNVYARIAENLAPRNGYPFPCRVQTLGLMYYDPLTEVDHPDKINTRGFLMEFHAHWVPIQRRDEWIDELLARAWAILSQPAPPAGAPTCKICPVYESIANALLSIA